jgi:mannobiose 2-epimerase
MPSSFEGSWAPAQYSRKSSPAGGNTDRAWDPNRLHGEFAAALDRHVRDVWFPRCLDPSQPGLRADFDRRWKAPAASGGDLLLEFQARQTWTAAELNRVRPRADLEAAARHGLTWLERRFWDDSQGGWFHRVSRDGEPREAGTKHVHGVAYAISCCAHLHQQLGLEAALPLARESFTWLERHARDEEHGGWFGFLNREGGRILTQRDNPLGSDVDTIGTPLGLQDANVASDLLAAFLHLHEVWPDPLLGRRILELVERLRSMATLVGGLLPTLFLPDGTPVTHLVRFGYSLQAASHLLAHRHAFPAGAEIKAFSQQLVDACLRLGWDDADGGLWFATPGTPPMWLEGKDLVVRRKVWWVQFELMKALLSLATALEEPERYRRLFLRQWAYIQNQLFDGRHGGVFPIARNSWPRRARLLGAAFAPRAYATKGRQWKDGSHDARALIHALDTFRPDPRTPRTAP